MLCWKKSYLNENLKGSLRASCYDKITQNASTFFQTHDRPVIDYEVGRETDQKNSKAVENQSVSVSCVIQFIFLVCVFKDKCLTAMTCFTSLKWLAEC